MKFISWNCNGGLRKKLKSLIELDADVMVIQECENPELTNDLIYKSWAKNYLWVGRTKNRGIGIFVKDGIELKDNCWSNVYEDEAVNYFISARINNSFDIVGVWAHKNDSINYGYIGQVWKYLELNKNKLNKALFVGDFNSNEIWDKLHGSWNHSAVVNTLKSVGLVSLYHKLNAEEFGKESVPTFYQYRKADKGYHIDYCFASSLFVSAVKLFHIGKLDKWLEMSDHLPIIADFK
jgi:exonuclease III